MARVKCANKNRNHTVPEPPNEWVEFGKVDCLLCATCYKKLRQNAFKDIPEEKEDDDCEGEE